MEWRKARVKIGIGGRISAASGFPWWKRKAGEALRYTQCHKEHREREKGALGCVGRIINVNTSAFRKLGGIHRLGEGSRKGIGGDRQAATGP